MAPLRFQVAMRRRFRWPLPLSRHTCRGKSCRAQLDEKGDHAASCSRSGLLKLRSKPMEGVLRRILREGGARVRHNVSLHEAGVPVDPEDGRNIEIVATGLPLHRGVPLAVDATMVSPLHSDGSPHRDAASSVGVALDRGRDDKERAYPELLASSRLRLVIVGLETGGRISKDGLDLLSTLAFSKAQTEPQALRSSISRCWRTRWRTMLSLVCQDSLSATLVDDGVGFLECVGTGSIAGADVWLDGR